MTAWAVGSILVSEQLPPSGRRVPTWIAPAPTRSVQNVVNDGEPEACAASAFIQASAAFERPLQLGWTNPLTVVLHND